MPTRPDGRHQRRSLAASRGIQSVGKWFCRSLGARSLAGGISQNVGRCEPGRCHTFASAKTNRAPSVGERGWCCGLRRTANFGVCTLCTLRAADWVELVPDRAGFRMFPREPSVCKGWNAVRVPPRAQCFRRSVAFLVLFGVHIVHTLASDLLFGGCGVPETSYSVVQGSGCLQGTGYLPPGPLCVFILVRPSLCFSRSPLHGGQGRVQHDLLIAFFDRSGIAADPEFLLFV